MRMSQQGTVPSLGQTSGPGRSTMRLLESHAIPGVMLKALVSYMKRQRMKEEIKEKDCPSERSGIVTLPRLLRECSHALKFRRQRCPQKAYSRHRLPRARVAYRDEVGWGGVDQPVVRKSGVPGEYPPPSLVREWQAVPA